MARRGALALALAASLALCASARAQALQRLTVTQLTLAADTAAPRTEVPFHLIVTAHVRERVQRLENVDLPILAELELLGDQSATTSDANGTTYRETITVVAHHSGDTTVAPVTLDAIDARDGKPKRYFSNPLTLHVQGPGVTAAAGEIALGAGRAFVALLEFLVALGALVAIVVLVLRRPRRTVTPAPQPEFEPLPPPRPVRTRADELHDALLVLRGEPTRAGAMRVRSAVRRMVGATDAETLDDVLRTVPPNDPMHGLLRALERASFTHGSDLNAAIRDALAQLERVSA